MLATVAGVLPSCDDEIDEDPGNGMPENVEVNKKFLVSTTYKKHGHTVEEYEYEYDSNGKIFSKHSPNNKYFNLLNCVDYYLNNQESVIYCTSSFNPDGTMAGFYTRITNAMIDSVVYDHITESKYTYDEDKHLVGYDSYNMETGEKDCPSKVWTWEDGNITKFTETYPKNGECISTEWSYEYTNNDVTTPLENKTDLLFYGYGSNLDCINRYGVVGKNLPVIITHVSSGEKTRIDWTLDDDGYPVKVVFRFADNNGNPLNEPYIIGVMDLVWK